MIGQGERSPQCCERLATYTDLQKSVAFETFCTDFRLISMAYRDQHAVLLDQKVELERAQEAVRTERVALDQQERSIESELQGLRTRLVETKPSDGASLLENLKIATPCPAKWEDMVGSNRERHCKDCKKSVFNISGMTKVEAEAFLASTPFASAQNEKPCVTFLQRADGTILTSDCLVGQDRRRRLKVLKAVAAGVVLTCAAVGTLVHQYQESQPHRSAGAML
jgi:hypothetical protein